jgi:hypothetical protein
MFVSAGVFPPLVAALWVMAVAASVGITLVTLTAAEGQLLPAAFTALIRIEADPDCVMTMGLAVLAGLRVVQLLPSLFVHA